MAWAANFAPIGNAWLMKSLRVQNSKAQSLCYSLANAKDASRPYEAWVRDGTKCLASLPTYTWLSNNRIP